MLQISALKQPKTIFGKIMKKWTWNKVPVAGPASGPSPRGRFRVVDLGTGTGVCGLAAALTWPDAEASQAFHFCQIPQHHGKSDLGKLE